MYLVTWIKLFTNGNLKGLTFESKLRFISKSDAERYYKFLVDHSLVAVDTVSSSRYTCHMPQFIYLNN